MASGQKEKVVPVPNHFHRSSICQNVAPVFRLGHFNKVEQKYQGKLTFLDFPYF